MRLGIYHVYVTGEEVERGKDLWGGEKKGGGLRS